jgi:hypothetical protein
MAQVFWEQIQNELPDIGEFLTGSLNISGSFAVSGSLSLNFDGVDDRFQVSVNGESKVRINREGTLQLAPQEQTPTPITGGIFYSSSQEYYLGFPNL